MLKLQSSGARNFNHYRTKDNSQLSGIFIDGVYDKLTASCLLDDRPPDLSAMEFISEQRQQSTHGSGGVCLPAASPFLGRGLLPGTEVDLTSTLKPNMSTAKVNLFAQLQLY